MRIFYRKEIARNKKEWCIGIAIYRLGNITAFVINIYKISFEIGVEG